MAEHTIAVVVGSLRKDSFNRRLANALARLAPAELELRQLRIDDLPLYNQDHEADPAPAVKRLKGEIRAASGSRPSAASPRARGRPHGPGCTAAGRRCAAVAARARPGRGARARSRAAC